MKITRISLKNFKGLAKLNYFFEWEFNNGKIKLIKGENGYGKTTLLENLHPYPYMLTRDIKKSIIYPATKEIEFIINNDKFIGKIIYENENTTKGYLYKNGELIKETEKGNITEYEYQINKVLNFNFEKLKVALFMKQNTFEIINANPSERLKKIKTFLPNLDIYDIHKEKFKEKEKELLNMLKIYKEEINNLHIYEDKYKKVKQKEKFFNEKKKEELLTELEKLEVNYNDFILINEQYQNLLNLYNEKEKLKQEKKDLTLEKEKLLLKIKNIKNYIESINLKQLLNKKEKFEKILNGIETLKLFNIYTKNDYIDIVSLNKNEIEKLEIKIKNLINEINNLRKKVKIYYLEENNLKNLEKDIKNKKQELSKINIKELEEKKEKIIKFLAKNNNTKIEDEIKKYENEKEFLEKELFELNQKKTELENKNELKQAKEKIKKELKEIEKTVNEQIKKEKLNLDNINEFEILYLNIYKKMNELKLKTFINKSKPYCNLLKEIEKKGKELTEKLIIIDNFLKENQNLYLKYKDINWDNIKNNIQDLNKKLEKNIKLKLLLEYISLTENIKIENFKEKEILEKLQNINKCPICGNEIIIDEISINIESLKNLNLIIKEKKLLEDIFNKKEEICTKIKQYEKFIKEKTEIEKKLEKLREDYINTKKLTTVEEIIQSTNLFIEKEFNIEDINNKIAKINKIKTFINKKLLLKNKEDEIENKLKKYENLKYDNLKTLSEKLKEVKNDINKIINKIKNKNEILLKINYKSNELKLINEKIKNYNKLNNEIKELNKKITRLKENNINEKIKSIENELNLKEEELEKLKKEKDNISQKLEIKEKISEFEFLLEYFEKINEIKNEKNYIEHEIKKYEEYKNELKIKRVKKENLEKDIEKLKKKILENKINKKEIDKLKKKKEKLEPLIINYKEKKREILETLEKINEFIIYKNDIEKIYNEYMKKKEKIINLEDEIFIIKKLKLIPDKIKKTLILSTFENIVNIANEIIKNEGEIKLKINILQVNEKTFKINVKNLQTGIEVEDISLLSGAEKIVIEKGLLIALNKFNNLKTLWLDESDSAFSSKNKIIYVNMLKNITNLLNLENIFIISHSELIENEVDEIIDLNKLIKKY